MGITVDFQTFGVEIKNPDREKAIFLQPNAWACLVECKKQIDEIVKKKNEFQWKIDSSKDIRVHTNTYQGKGYVHIRYWWQDRPTKQGVSFLEKEWSELKSYLADSKEAGLGKAVFKQMLKERVHDILRNDCEGCIKDWPSQNDHECLQDQRSRAELCIERAQTKVTAIDFILLLAQAACKEKVILEMPHQTFKRILLFHSDHIQKEVVDQYDY